MGQCVYLHDYFMLTIPMPDPFVLEDASLHQTTAQYPSGSHAAVFSEVDETRNLITVNRASLSTRRATVGGSPQTAELPVTGTGTVTMLSKLDARRGTQTSISEAGAITAGSSTASLYAPYRPGLSQEEDGGVRLAGGPPCVDDTPPENGTGYIHRHSTLPPPYSTF